MAQSNFQKWWKNAKNRFSEITEHAALQLWLEIVEETKKNLEKNRSKRGLRRLEGQRAWNKFHDF